MNTNSNIYTLIYTSAVVVVVAAVLAYAAMKLQPMQNANIKAETLSQMMTAAGLGTKSEISAHTNNEILAMYVENIDSAVVINLEGEYVRTLSTSINNIELIANLKAQNKAIKAGKGAELPVYIFNTGVAVIPVYGAGLWGPVWGYIALNRDLTTISGAYFDHEGETPGLGAKIKDEPWFQEQFKGKKIDFASSENHFGIVKGGAKGENEVDAISGATMTCRGLNGAINVWAEAYAAFAKKYAVTEEAPAVETTVAEEGNNNE